MITHYDLLFLSIKQTIGVLIVVIIIATSIAIVCIKPRIFYPVPQPPTVEFTQGLTTHDVVLLRSDWFDMGRPKFEIGTEDTAYYAHAFIILNDSTIKMYGNRQLTDSLTYSGQWGVSKIDIIHDESLKH